MSTVYHASVPVDLAAPSRQHLGADQFWYGDHNSHVFTALVADTGEPDAGLRAGTVTGTALRADKTTVVLEGEKGEAVEVVTFPDGKQANGTPCRVTLPQEAFAVPGPLQISIKLVNSPDVITVLSITGTVIRTDTDSAVDPGEIIPDIAAIREAAASAVEAAEAATEAAAEAEEAARHSVRYDEVQSLTDAEKQQARDNIRAEATPLVPILPEDADYTAGYVSAQPGDTAVAMDTSGTDPIPAVTSASNTSVLRRETAEGDMYTIVSGDRGDRSYACMFVSATGDILGHYTAPKTNPAVITAPANTAWFILNVWPRASGTANRAWIGESTADRVSALEARVTDDETAIGGLDDRMTAAEGDIDSLETAVGNRVRYDAAQALTDTQKAQARVNIDAAGEGDITAAVAAEAALREAGDASTLSTAKSYADGIVGTEATARESGDAATLSAAKSYADGIVGAEATARAGGDADTLSAAKSYADGIVGTEATARSGGDADTLSTAKSYADGLVTDVLRYSAQSLTDAQKTQARTNIGAVGASDVPTGVVRYDEVQSLTNAQRTQARANILAERDGVLSAVCNALGVVDYNYGTDAQTLTYNGVTITRNGMRLTFNGTDTSPSDSYVRLMIGSSIFTKTGGGTADDVSRYGVVLDQPNVYMICLHLVSGTAEPLEGRQIPRPSATASNTSTAGLRDNVLEVGGSAYREYTNYNGNGKVLFSLLYQNGTKFTNAVYDFFVIDTGSMLSRAMSYIGASLAVTEQPVATAAHAVDDLIVVNGRLCKVTSAIAIGDNLRFGGASKNCEPASVDSLFNRTIEETVSGATPTITAVANHSYKCTGTVTEMHFTPCATGLCEVRFTTGSTPVWDTTTGAIMPAWFTGLEAGYTYEMSFQDGYGVVMAWPT